MTLRIGIDLGGTKIEGLALVNDVEKARVRVVTPRDDYVATLEAIVGVVERLETQTGATGSVGIGIPGTLSLATGLVKNSNSVWLTNQPLGEDLEKLLRRSVRIANDADCFAVSEAIDGAGIDARVVFGVILGTGVGGGVVVDGRPLDGPNSVAGEWGHNPLPYDEGDEWPGPTCYCGRHGCIETFLSGPGLAADYAKVAGRKNTPEAISMAAVAGEPVATAALQRYERRLARALASVINLLDPDLIVLGGGLSNLERLYDNIPVLWTPYVFGAGVEEPVRTRLVRARHGDASGVRGAAWLWNTRDAD
jgi:fructokinase